MLSKPISSNLITVLALLNQLQYALYFLGKDGSFWVASEMKVLVEDCVTFDAFPPGHIYDSKQVMLSNPDMELLVEFSKE